MSKNDYEYYFNGGIDETKEFKDFMAAMDVIGKASHVSATELNEFPNREYEIID